MSISHIRAALNEGRYETARRMARAEILHGGADHRELLLLLHEANRQLGDFVACRETLDAICPKSTAEKREILLLQAGDFAAYAKEGHYRTSREAREGLSVDEFLDKYRALAERCQREADVLPAPPVPDPPGTIVPEPAIESQGLGVLRGRITFADGSAVMDATVTLGLHLGEEPIDPRGLTVTGLGYHPRVDDVRGLSTVTSSDGCYEFPEIPEGKHEFLSVTLDPLKFDLATHFLHHGIEVSAGQTLVLDGVVREWKSAEPLPPPQPPKRLTADLLDHLPMRNPFAFEFPRQVVEWETPHAAEPDISIIDPSGRAIPFQRDGGRLVFFAELPGHSERAYALVAGETEEIAASALRFEVEGATAIIHTGRASFRIPWGETQHPPLLALRGEDGCWRGRGRWVLPEGVFVKKTMTNLLETGPVRLRVAILTTFSNGQTHEIVLTAHSDEAYLLVRESSSDIPGAAFEFSLAEFSGGRGYLHWTPEKNGSPHWSTLEREDREIARLQESVPWWIPPAGFAYAVTMEGLAEKDYLGVFTVRRGEWIDRKFEAISQGPGNDPAWHRELDWPYPEMVGSTISMITAHTRADGDVVFRFGLFDGERQWGLLASNFERNDGPDKELAAVQHKNSSPRLTDFIQWKLDAADTAPRPHVVARREDLIRIRKKVGRPAFAKAWKNLTSPDARGPVAGLRFQIENNPLAAWRAKKELLALAPVRSRMTLLGRDAGDLYSPVGGRPITHYAEDFDLLAPSGIFTPDEERFLRAFLMLMGHMFLEPDLMNWHFNSRNANFEADRVDIVGTIGITFQGNPDADAFTRHAAELMERSLEVYCTPGSGKWYENPACYYLHAGKCRLNIAYHLATHGILDPVSLPRLKDFLTWGVLLLTPKQPASYDVMRDGCSREIFETVDRIRRIAPIGDHAVLGKYILDHAALLAPFYRATDPVFTQFLLWAYRETGSSGGSQFGNAALFLARMDEEELCVQHEPPTLQSRRLEGFGAVFRGNFGLADEFYLLFKQGPGGYRYHRTEGSFILFADGKPLVYDGGEGGETWRHSTLSFFDTHMPLAPGHVERFASFSKLDFCQGVHPTVIHPGDPVYLSDKCSHDLVPLAFARYHEANPANIRSLLWVKSDYLVVHDDLRLDPAIPRYWHLQAVANSETGNARDGFVFQGRFGTDLQVLLPGPGVDEEIVETVPFLEYNTAPETRFAMRHLRIQRKAADFYAAVLRPLTPGAEPVETNISPDGTHLRVQGSDIDDEHFFGRESARRTFAEGSLAARYGSVMRRSDSTTISLPGGGRLELEDRKVESDIPMSVTIRNRLVELEAFGPGTITIQTRTGLQTLVVSDQLNLKM
jgi:hypothetical protein